MMDFYDVMTTSRKKGELLVYPVFFCGKSKDLMIRGRDFYAVWDEETGLWTQDEDYITNRVDSDVQSFIREAKERTNDKLVPRLMRLSSSGVMKEWHQFVQSLQRDNYKPLDEKIVFDGQETKKTDYISKKLPYPLCEGPVDAYDEIMSTLYDPEERQKLEWAIGSIISGDSKKIQKFIVLFGDPGSGKSTFLKIVQRLFDGYWVTFDAKSLTSNDSFSLESFKTNPLIAIEDDGDLSRIETNTKLNSIVSHETVLVNEKNKPKYPQRFNAFLFIGTNKPVKITDAKSGVIRRLIDVNPSGRKIPRRRYEDLTDQVKFELSGIAWHCLNVYKSLGRTYYDNYIPFQMIGMTNDFYDFMEANYDTFDQEDSITLKALWTLYKDYCDYANVQYPFGMRQVRNEAMNYFKECKVETWVDGAHIRNLYSGFRREKFPGKKSHYTPPAEDKKDDGPWLIFEETESILDEGLSGCLAQYAKEDGAPEKAWDFVTTKLMDLDTHRLHYILLDDPKHIVIDFDIKGDDGKKSFEKNLEAALKFPPTYAELSKSGQGIHLHYIYDGDVTKLSRIYDDEIEVKVFTGKSSLRRMLTKCFNHAIAHISSGLPLKLKEVKDKVVDINVVNLEKSLRTTIKKCLGKEVHDSTAENVQFIKKILDDAYESGKPYDVSDLRQAVFNFANNSSHQAKECVKLYKQMKFKSEEDRDDVGFASVPEDSNPIIFYDIEVFPNLFILCWKVKGKPNVVKMINPTSKDLEPLIGQKLVGFNNRGYDNHILYARWARGYSNEKLYELSNRIINTDDKDAKFREAYNLSYTDVYDFSVDKKGLKKWEIELGINHLENEHPWNKPVDEKYWDEIAEYCANDVIATEEVFNKCSADFKTRELLADLSGLTVNDTNRQHITRILVGKKKSADHVYTDLSKLFPGYEIVNGKNVYRGTDVGRGGYVYAEPGMYRNVSLLDVGNMHGASIDQLNKFGPDTEKFREIRAARMAIKAHDFEKAKKMLGGKLAKYLGNAEEADNLQNALKLILNSTYGIAAASFDNPLKDPRDVNNIIALRGALFMRTLQDEVTSRGFKVVHIKTDSIKIPDASPELISFIIDFGRKYGYEFEYECCYDRMCLVNDAVYIAKYDEYGVRNKGGKKAGQWTATGAQFAHPYVFKELFSKEPIEFKDCCETKQVVAGEGLYLDMNEKLPEGEHCYRFVGRVGQFTPMISGCGAGELLRLKDGKYSAVGGTKGYRWMESQLVVSSSLTANVDKSYYRALCDAAIDNISKYGNFDDFIRGSFENIHKIVAPLPDFMNIPEGTDEVIGLPFN